MFQFLKSSSRVLSQSSLVLKYGIFINRYRQPSSKYLLLHFQSLFSQITHNIYIYNKTQFLFFIRREFNTGWENAEIKSMQIL